MSKIDRTEFLSSPSDTTDEVKLTPSKTRSDISAESIAKLPESKPELSLTIEEIIKLRDWVLLAKNSKTEEGSEVLSAIYQKLGQILAGERVIGIEETGFFNYERQKIIANQITHNREQDNCICNTVRPGYLFDGELIRPQEVIVYTFEPTDL